jgi:serine/threonine protein kinase
MSRVATGAVIADFIILEELGRGGMGIVYLAHQITLDRPAALKILADQYAGDPEYVVDFIKEARAAAKLNHPHIVQAYAVGEDEGIFFFAMEHIDGETMKDFMKREGVVPVDFAVMVVQQIAEALDYAWKEQRLIHRDIKPDNIMLTRKGRAKLADLGLARVAGDIDDADADEVMGTPQYISPEHLTGDEMDVRSDIYSLGATFFHFVTGRFAFEGRTATEIDRKHLEEALTSPRKLNPGLPEAVSKIIIKMMAKNPAERYQSAEALAEDLRLARQGKSPGAGGGRPGKQFSVKKSGKTLTMRSATATGTHTTTTATGSHPKMSSTASGVGMSREELLAERERKAKTQIITLVAVCVAVVVAVGAYLAWRHYSNLKGKEEKPSAKSSESTAAQPKVPGVPAQPKSTEYTVAVDKLLVFAAKNRSAADILVKTDDFLSKHPEPKYDCEKEAFKKLMAVYIPLDEKRIAKARAVARKKYLSVLKKREEEERRKLEAELSAKRAKERKEREKLLAKQRIQQEKERKATYEKEQDQVADVVRYRSLYQSMSGDFASAGKAFDQAIKEPSVAPSTCMERAKKVAAWGKRMKKHVEVATELDKVMRDAGTKLNGLQLEVERGVLGKVVKISGGKVAVKTFDGKLKTVPIDNLSLVQFKRLVSTAASKLMNDSAAAFHYFMCVGQFMTAKEVAPDDWKQELSDSIQAYLKKKLRAVEGIESPAAKRKAMQDLFLRCGRAEMRKAAEALKKEDVDSM